MQVFFISFLSPSSLQPTSPLPPLRERILVLVERSAKRSEVARGGAIENAQRGSFYTFSSGCGVKRKARQLRPACRVSATMLGEKLKNFGLSFPALVTFFFLSKPKELQVEKQHELKHQKNYDLVLFLDCF